MSDTEDEGEGAEAPAPPPPPPPRNRVSRAQYLLTPARSRVSGPPIAAVVASMQQASASTVARVLGTASGEVTLSAAVDPNLTALDPAVTAFVDQLDAALRERVEKAIDAAMKSIDLAKSLEEARRQLGLIYEAGTFDDVLRLLRAVGPPDFLATLITSGSAVSQGEKLDQAKLPIPDPAVVSDAGKKKKWIVVIGLSIIGCIGGAWVGGEFAGMPGAEGVGALFAVLGGMWSLIK